MGNRNQRNRLRSAPPPSPPPSPHTPLAHRLPFGDTLAPLGTPFYVFLISLKNSVRGQPRCLGVSAAQVTCLDPQLSQAGICCCLTWVESILTSCRSWVTLAPHCAFQLGSKTSSSLVQSCNECLSF